MQNIEKLAAASRLALHQSVHSSALPHRMPHSYSTAHPSAHARDTMAPVVPSLPPSLELDEAPPSLEPEPDPDPDPVSSPEPSSLEEPRSSEPLLVPSVALESVPDPVVGPADRLVIEPVIEAPPVDDPPVVLSVLDASPSSLPHAIDPRRASPMTDRAHARPRARAAPRPPSVQMSRIAV